MDEHFSIETGGDLGIPHFKNPPDVDIFPGAPCQAFEWLRQGWWARGTPPLPLLAVPKMGDP